MKLFRLKDDNCTNQKVNGSALIPLGLVLACFAISPMAQAVVPAPDGGYPGGNTAEGQNALFSLTSGGYNTAIGFFSLRSATTSSFNTAIGAGTLLFNTADENTATGAAALLSNTSGFFNTANGAFALFSNTTGSENTANGHLSLFSNTTGSINTALGYNAGFDATTGSGNVYIGAFVYGVPPESDHTYIRNINTTSVGGGGFDSVTVDLTTGLLGHATSSRRYKEDIKPMDKASEALYRLNPVTYRYKKEIDATQTPAFGLIAEEVAEVNPDLVAHNVKEQPESVHYEMVNAMLLNEFLKEHRKVAAQGRRIQEQETTIAELKKDFRATVAQLTARLEEQQSQIQKVSDHVELSKNCVATRRQ